MGRSIREIIAELVEKEIEELTGSGAAGAFATPNAFATKKPVSSKKKVRESVSPKRRVVAGAINEAAKNEWFGRRANDFLRKVQSKLDIHYKKAFPKFRGNDTKLSFDKGTKYWRIVANSGGSRRVWAFLDTKTGDILKAAGWKAPAKGARGNIFDAGLGIDGLGPFGPNYSDPWRRSFDQPFQESVNEGTAPEWEYSDGRGVKHHGHVQNVIDHGGTDVTYFFIDKDSGELTLINGPRVKTHTKRVGNVSSEPHSKYFRKNEGVNEAGDPYYHWRNDQSKSPKQKIGTAISEINKQLAEMQRVVNRSSRLKKEMGMSANDYWKRTNNAFLKMEQRMHRISQKIREMRV